VQQPRRSSPALVDIRVLDRGDSTTNGDCSPRRSSRYQGTKIDKLGGERMNELSPASKLERSIARLEMAGYGALCSMRLLAQSEVRDLLFTGHLDSLWSTGIERRYVGDFKA
jgi:hypothetical protein